MIEKEISELIKKSLSNTQYNSEIVFDISFETIDRIRKKIGIDMTGYKCVIKSNEIRHVYKRHPDDVLLICEIPNIIQKFQTVEKSITKDAQIKKPVIS